MSKIFDFTARDINGEDQSLDIYRGRVLLVVNLSLIHI